MDVSAKLQIKPGQRIATVGMPGDVPPIAGEGAADTPEAADVVVAFVRSKAELATVAVPAIDAARRDKLAWIAYPKAGKLWHRPQRGHAQRRAGGRGRPAGQADRHRRGVVGPALSSRLI
jgi:hypothetical protein